MEGSSTLTSITTSLKTAISSVSNDLLAAIGDNLPVILGVGAAFIVIPGVWKLVKRFAK